MNNLSSSFIYKDTYSLASEFERFMTKLPNPDKLWNSSNLRYGCCGLAISKVVGSSAECTNCLETVQIKTKQEYAVFGDGYNVEKTFYPVMVDTSYKKTESGDFIVTEKDYYKEIALSELSEYIKTTYPGIKCDKIQENFKKYRVDAPIRMEMGLIHNIRSILFEGLPNHYSQYDERISSTNFSVAEMDYLRDLELYSEFCDLLAFKQIFINEMLVKALDMIVHKMQGAGMNLL